SFVNRGWKVVPAVIDVVPVTLSLVVGAAILWVIGGVVIGLVAAATRGSVLDRTLMILGLIGVSMPVYWLGEVMNLLTQARLHDTWLFAWVPPLGYKPLTADPVGWFLPRHSLDHPGHALYGALRARSSGQSGRGRAGGLHPHRPCQGPERDAHPRPPRPAHLADHDRY